MNKPFKTYLLIAILLTSVTVVIFFDKPLFLGIAFTCAIGALLVTEKYKLPKLIIANTVSVYKTMLLMFLISITIPVLMSSGTLPTLIYHVSSLMVNNNLLLSAFISATLLSMILGSAIGTLTILLPLFTSIVFQAGIPFPILIGALISGVYIGDRCSPLSSGLHLLSSITETDYVKNMKLLLLSAVPPFIISLIFFATFGRNTIITSEMIASNGLLIEYYDITLWRLLPLVAMIFMLLIKQPITRVLTVVFTLCAIITILDGVTIRVFFQSLFNGYETPYAELTSFIKTSGFKQMINVILVIFLSGVLNSILEADHLIGYIITPFTSHLTTKRQLMRNAGLLSILLSMVTCSQAMTSMIGGKYLAPYFDKMQIKRELLVLATANTGLNIVALIPWNVNGIMIKQLTDVSPLDYLVYSVFVVLLTIFTLLIYPLFVKETHHINP